MMRERDDEKEFLSLSSQEEDRLAGHFVENHCRTTDSPCVL